MSEYGTKTGKLAACTQKAPSPWRNMKTMGFRQGSYQSSVMSYCCSYKLIALLVSFRTQPRPYSCIDLAHHKDFRRTSTPETWQAAIASLTLKVA
eukprot:scaffold35813_cov17-Prasinocladus_malaysianus.AAC.1